ncbi:GMC family oxidoreductase N-terminal domain-containing protein [Streptomyces sp. NBC_01485]|uniref:GMC family oxidoreductase n=1 Tax=Streptomyces sp. NBC_01485 TaxID=2903884 RepID=UPI002E34C3B1|nr:GMC family oxidoreductase N-terminal domain-containing protein [Streptomyces sp. NBC_01485]
MSEAAQSVFDYVVVGGGTAGAVIASRLSEDPGVSVGLLEWGPSDREEPRALQIRRWFEMLEGEYDLDYRSVHQPRGNSHIRQSRARILGGCSTHNTMIALRPPAADFSDWVERGAVGWDAATMFPYYDRLLTHIVPVAEEHRNPYLADVVKAAATALDIPVRERWNDRPYADGVGFLEIGYYPETGVRSSSSVDYLHPVMDDRPNLSTLLETRVTRVLFTPDRRAYGVEVRRADGSTHTVRARHEVVLCAGAIDTPRLLLLSGVGPAEELRALGIPVVLDSPGVGRNLSDHPEGLIVWEATEPIPGTGATDWDMSVMARVDPDAVVPQILMHVPLMTYAVHAERLGCDIPRHSISMTPNVARPHSRGTVRLASADPAEAPLIDYRNFTDPEGHDERLLVEGIRIARRIAATAPMARWVGREVFPGPEVVTDEEISALVRATSHTVYHVSCTARMGADGDHEAVLDPSLRVRGTSGLRVADASAFPSLTTVNPVVAVLMLAERAAELLRAGG